MKRIYFAAFHAARAVPSAVAWSHEPQRSVNLATLQASRAVRGVLDLEGARQRSPRRSQLAAAAGTARRGRGAARARKAELALAVASLGRLDALE
jgi:hypothetical protein